MVQEANWEIRLILAELVLVKSVGINKVEKVGKRNQPRPRKVIFELVDDRNALERVLLHFAHFEKQVGKIDDRKYQVTLHYDKEDETEILIRVLSFGPMIRVVKPWAFINLIKGRLSDQKSCGL